jgi:hypothetical protein
MYVIPDDVMERLLRDLDGAKRRLDWVIAPMTADNYNPDIAGSRNIIATVRDELAQYKEEK